MPVCHLAKKKNFLTRVIKSNLKTLKKIALITNILLATLLLVSYFSVYISPEKTLVVTLLPFVTGILLVCNLVFAVFWIFFNWKLSLISIISIFAGIKFINLIFPILGLFNSGNTEGDFKIMSYNVMIFGWYNWENNINIKSDIIKLIDDEDSDIVCLQEAYWNSEKRNFITLDSVQTTLEADYIYKSAMATAMGGQNFGLATISKHPIVNTFSHTFEGSYNGFIYTDILLNKDTVRDYNCHLQSIQLNQNDYTLIEEFNESDDNTKLKLVLKKYLKSLTKRAQQAEMVKANMDTCSYPIFVCGDFNDAPLTYTYFTIAKGLKDSFASKGKYPGYTWDNFKIKQRIDYILFDKKFNCTNHKVIQEAYSDHYPITASFKL